MTTSAVQSACDAIDSNADELVTEVIDGWGKIATAEPWLSLPSTVSHDHLADLLHALAHAALCELHDPGARRRLVERGAQHGEDRLLEGFSEELLYREYHLLRTFLWDWIRRRWGTLPDAHDAILLLDSAITLATSASLRGYHRQTLEKQGRWPGALTELIDEYWPVAD